MRKIVYAAIMAVALLCLCACDLSGMSSLPDVTRPYAAMYECDELTLGGEDRLENFEYIRLNLVYGGDFSLEWRTKSGEEGSQNGTYSVDAEHREITLSASRGGRTVSRTFPCSDGAILIDLNLFGKLLHARFSMP